MRFNQRRDWLYDPGLFSRYDVRTALAIHAEYVRKHSPLELPKFFEVDRTTSKVDTLWHVPKAGSTPISRVLSIPAIHYAEKPRWTMTPTGLVPKSIDKFWLANLILQEPGIDYFPERGDSVFWNGYRMTILEIDMEPTSYWQQTNVWLGLSIKCSIVPEGDARPVENTAAVAPSEVSPGGQIAAEEVELIKQS